MSATPVINVSPVTTTPVMNHTEVLPLAVDTVAINLAPVSATMVVKLVSVPATPVINSAHNFSMPLPIKTLLVLDQAVSEYLDPLRSC